MRARRRVWEGGAGTWGTRSASALAPTPGPPGVRARPLCPPSAPPPPPGPPTHSRKQAASAQHLWGRDARGHACKCPGLQVRGHNTHRGCWRVALATLGHPSTPRPHQHHLQSGSSRQHERFRRGGVFGREELARGALAARAHWRPHWGRPVCAHGPYAPHLLLHHPQATNTQLQASGISTAPVGARCTWAGVQVPRAAGQGAQHPPRSWGTGARNPRASLHSLAPDPAPAAKEQHTA